MLYALTAPPAGWTGKEVLLYILAAVGGTLSVVIPVAWGLVRILNQRAERRVNELETENNTLQRTLKEIKSLQLDCELQEQLEGATKSIGQLEVTLAQVRNQANGYKLTLEGISGERDELLVERNEARERLKSEELRIHKAVQKNGVTWTEKVLHSAPDFKPLNLSGRRTPVISVLNLKGGVGKTTTTANLGAALARRGWRVLLVDLDLQGSLSSMFLTATQQEALFQQGKLLGDFLDASFDAEFPNILDYATPVLPGTKTSLVPTTDAMAYAETNLTVRWYLKESRRDPRFLLRKELQLKRVTNQFDIVLLDCPPFINVSCVNALAASDYVLVPVLPSKQATDRVTILIDRLKEFHDNLNTDLKMMGFFANRTKGSELTYDERNRMTALRDKCKDTWAAAPCFDTCIRQSVDVRKAEDECRPLSPDDELYQAFDSLAQEVENYLPTFCQPTERVDLREEASL